MEHFFEEFVGVDFWTSLFVLLNTLLIFFVAKKYICVPVKNMIDARQKEIDTMYDDARKAQENAQAMEAEYSQKLSQAAEAGQQLVKEAVERGQKREEEIILQANTRAAALLDKANADIAQEKKKALNDAKDEISDMAMAIAAKVVGRELNDADQSKLVDQFIEELGDGV